jgi:hypothetical protein
MKWPPKREGALPAPIPLLFNSATSTAFRLPLQANEENVDRPPLVCSTQRRSQTRERESRALLRHIVAKLSEIQAQLHSPLAVRQLHLRYCAICRERVTNANCGGFEGRSALTGRLFCELCADEMEDVT